MSKVGNIFPRRNNRNNELFSADYVAGASECPAQGNWSMGYVRGNWSIRQVSDLARAAEQPCGRTKISKFGPQQCSSIDPTHWSLLPLKDFLPPTSLSLLLPPTNYHCTARILSQRSYELQPPSVSCTFFEVLPFWQHVWGIQGLRTTWNNSTIMTRQWLLKCSLTSQYL